MTDRYAVVGNPVEHSKSPQIHTAFALQTGQDIEFVRLVAPLDGFRASVDAFRAEGGCGASITIPFKLEAYNYADEVTVRAKDARAANCLRFESGHALADNTDGVGLVRDITLNLGIAIADKRVLLMGAGGAAQGVLVPLLEQQPAILSIANRTVDKALRLADTCRHHASSKHTVVTGSSYEELAGRHFDLIINATASSLAGALPPLPAGVFAQGAAAYDLMYGKGLTPFLTFAREHGAQQLADGLGMLVEQAAEAFQLWRGVRPQTRPVIGRLRGD